MALISFIPNSWVVLTSNLKMDQCCPQIRFFILIVASISLHFGISFTDLKVLVVNNRKTGCILPCSSQTLVCKLLLYRHWLDAIAEVPCWTISPFPWLQHLLHPHLCSANEYRKVYRRCKLSLVQQKIRPYQDKSRLT
jgi:hypothetical protein